jgi:hypothetical protein
VTSSTQLSGDVANAAARIPNKVWHRLGQQQSAGCSRCRRVAVVPALSEAMAARLCAVVKRGTTLTYAFSVK